MCHFCSIYDAAFDTSDLAAAVVPLMDSGAPSMAIKEPVAGDFNRRHSTRAIVPRGSAAKVMEVTGPASWEIGI